jgi:hypothetical protein
MNYKHNTPPESNQPQERIAVLRSAHGRADGSTFTTSASFIVSPSGVRLLAGRSVTARAANALTRNAEAHERATSNVRQFPPRTPRPTSPTTTRREAA